MPHATPTIGVLALQGDFDAHKRTLEKLGANVVLVRKPEQLDEIDGLIIPGGESSAFLKLLGEAGFGKLHDFVRSKPVFGTCAGMIMLDRDHLGVLDIRTSRNAFGRQLHSFETDLEIDGLAGGPVHAVFIRAPYVAEHGDGVDVLSAIDEHPVAIRQGNVLAVAFHPELAGETRLHELLLGMNGRAS